MIHWLFTNKYTENILFKNLLLQWLVTDDVKIYVVEQKYNILLWFVVE